MSAQKHFLYQSGHGNGSQQLYADQVEKTAAIPDSSTISRIADYFEVPVEYVMGVSTDSQIDEANFRLAELEKAQKTATAEEADEIAVEIDGLRESLHDLTFIQTIEAAADRQDKKNTRPAKSGTGNGYAKAIYDFVDSCEAGQLATLRSTLSF